MCLLYFRNPESYDAKIDFWINTIELWLECKSIYKFTPEKLARSFTYNNRKPLCLEEVLVHMKDNRKTILDANEYLTSLTSSWSDIPLKMLKAGTSVLFSAISSPKSPQQRKDEFNTTHFIHLGQLERRAQALLARIKDVGDLYCKKSDIRDTEQDVDIVLDYLKYQSKVIDFRSIDDDVYIKCQEGKMTDTDAAIISTELSVNKLEVTVAELDHKVRETKMELKNCIAKGESKWKQKRLLRTAKYLEKDLETKSKTLDNLNIVFQSLQEVENNKLVIGNLKIAREALAKEVKEVGDDVKAQELINDIRDLVDANNDVAEILKNAQLSDETEIDDETLEKELNQLLDEENELELKAALDKLSVGDTPLEDTDSAIGDTVLENLEKKKENEKSEEKKKPEAAV